MALYEQRVRDQKAKVKRNEQRFQECLYPIFTKGVSFTWGMYCFWDKPWLYDRKQFFKGWPDDMGFDCCIPDIKLIYMVHLGWYLYKTFAQTFLDRHLKDYWPTMIHHAAAIGLLVLSWSTGMVLVGVVVLLLHDPADVILQSGKIFKLMHCKFMMNACFVLLVVAWFVTRLVVFPYLVIAAPFTDFYPVFGRDGHQWMDVIVLMLCALYILHLNWFYLIFSTFLKAVSGQMETKDVRSDTDDEEEDGGEVKTTRMRQ